MKTTRRLSALALILLVSFLSGAPARSHEEDAPTALTQEFKSAPSKSKQPRSVEPGTSSKRTSLKLGEVVALSRCEKDPSKCICQHNSRGVRFIGSGHTKNYVCVTSGCPAGKSLQVRATASGSREGVCQ